MTKSGRQIVVTTYAPPPATSLQDKVVRAIRSFDAAGLRELTSEMRGADVIINYDFLGQAEVKRTRGPPLCILLHQIKTFDSSITGLIPGLLEVVVRDWGKDPNEEVNVTESWPAHPQVATRDMTCAAMSWLMNVRNERAINMNNLRCCITSLIALGADVMMPFKLNYLGDPSTQNGLSLPYIAIRIMKSLACADCLLDAGARFLPTDPAPMCAAIRKFNTNDAVSLFYRHWRNGGITRDDVLRPETLTTAIHLFIYAPPQDAKVAMDMLLEMGYTPKTERANGQTALDFAKECAPRTPAQRAVYDHLIAVQLAHAREMGVASERVLRNAPIPPEIIKTIWDRLEYGGFTIEEAKRASDRVRNFQSL